MNKQTLLGLLLLTVSSSLIAEEYILSEYYEEIIAQPEISLELNITSLESNETVLESNETIELSPYEKVLLDAKSDGKVIMLAIRATDCNYCDKMEEETLSDESVKEVLEANFITIYYNQDLEPLPLGLQEGMTPTFVFVDNDENILNMYPGMRTPDEFKEVLEEILAQ